MNTLPLNSSSLYTIEHGSSYSILICAGMCVWSCIKKPKKKKNMKPGSLWDSELESHLRQVSLVLKCDISTHASEHTSQKYIEVIHNWDGFLCK